MGFGTNTSSERSGRSGPTAVSLFAYPRHGHDPLTRSAETTRVRDRVDERTIRRSKYRKRFCVWRRLTGLLLEFEATRHGREQRHREQDRGESLLKLFVYS